METAVLSSPLNTVQQHLLKMFSFSQSESSLKELQAVLFDHYRGRLKVQTDEFWKKNSLDASKMEEIMYGHHRHTAK